MTTSQMKTLDVREDFRAGRNPCDKIQNALGSVKSGKPLRLLVPFEPVPLFEVGRNLGLIHEARKTPDGDWEVLFSYGNPRGTKHTEEKQGGCGGGCSHTAPEAVVDVDARGLEPPQPMVKILEALEGLPEDATLSAQTDRRPIHLYPMLEARGFTGTSEEQSDGSFITYIVRR